MKVKTLSKEALEKMTGNLSPKLEDTQEPVEEPKEEFVEEPEVEDQLPEVDPRLEELETENLQLKDQLTVANAAVENSKELVTNLSEGLRNVVNSMKISMGHVELDESCVGEALLKEYEFTSNKFMESMPTGSLVDEPETKKVDKPQSAITSKAVSADYKNMPWSK